MKRRAISLRIKCKRNEIPHLDFDAVFIAQYLAQLFPLSNGAQVQVAQCFWLNSAGVSDSSVAGIETLDRGAVGN